MKPPSWLTLVLVLLWISPVTGRASPPDLPQPSPDFYEKYPVYKTFFPFGLYGGLQNLGWDSNNLRYMDDDRGCQFWAEFQRENYFNVVWGQMTAHFDLKDGRYVLDESARLRNKWMRELDIHIIPSLQYWFDPKHGEAFKGQELKNRFFTEAEIGAVISSNRAMFEAVPMLRQELGDRMIALMTGDEPISQRFDQISAMQMVKRFLPDLPVTWVTGAKAHTFPFLPHMELICSESYGRHESYGWNNRDLFLEYYRTSPETVVWNDILVGIFNFEPTLPGLPDGRPKQGEVRLAFWQSLAGGAKGFVSYLPRLHPSWWVGDKSFFNQFGKDVKCGNLSVVREIGREFTSAGPLLLSCRPAADEIPLVKFQTHPLAFPFFQGPALDCGVLRDKQNDKLHYVIVYNNNVDGAEAGAMTLPVEWLASAKVFNLHTLKEVAADPTGVHPVEELKPGDGRIYLISPRADFEKCKRAVLGHRLHNELIRLETFIRELAPVFAAKYVHASQKKHLIENLPDIVAQAENIRRDSNSIPSDLEQLYQQVLELHDRVQRVRAADQVGQVNRRFRIMEESMAEIDKLIEAFSWELFGYSLSSNTLYTQAPKNLDLLLEYMNLTAAYFACKNMYWRGLINPDVLLQMDHSARQAEKLMKHFQNLVDEQLQTQRRPIRVLFITPQGHDLEFFEIFSWLYVNFPAVYGRVQEDGTVTDRDGEKLSPDDFDVVWLHGLRTAAAVNPKDDRPGDVLPAEFIQKPLLEQLRQRLDRGKSVMLSGIMALMVVPLGLEDTPPNVVQDLSSPNPPMLRGFIANPGFEQHPIFEGPNDRAIRVTKDNLQEAAGYVSPHNPVPKAFLPRGKGSELRFTPDGFYTSGHYPGAGLFCECTWKNQKLRGRVIADVYDSTFEELDGYAGIIEHGGEGQGKVLVAGAQPFDFSPGNFSTPRFWALWKCVVRGLAYNMICYLGAKETFQPDLSAVKVTARAREKPQFLPVDNWLFRTDPHKVGEQERWFQAELDAKGWQPIRVDSNWETQGFANYDGVGWYRRVFTAANRPGKRTFLHFGAVDEEAVVYLDGKLAGRHQEGPDGWDQPFEIDITEFLTETPSEHLLAVEVYDSMAAGGIWKPVSLKYQ